MNKVKIFEQEISDFFSIFQGPETKTKTTVFQKTKTSVCEQYYEIDSLI